MAGFPDTGFPILGQNADLEGGICLAGGSGSEGSCNFLISFDSLLLIINRLGGSKLVLRRLFHFNKNQRHFK